MQPHLGNWLCRGVFGFNLPEAQEVCLAKQRRNQGKVEVIGFWRCRKSEVPESSFLPMSAIMPHKLTEQRVVCASKALFRSWRNVLCARPSRKERGFLQRMVPRSAVVSQLPACGPSWTLFVGEVKFKKTQLVKHTHRPPFSHHIKVYVGRRWSTKRILKRS